MSKNYFAPLPPKRVRELIRELALCYARAAVNTMMRDMEKPKRIVKKIGGAK